MAAALVAAVLPAAPATADTDTVDGTGLRCGFRSVSVPIVSGGAATQTLKGTMCWRGFSAPPVVHLLIAGATYSQHYWLGDLGGRSYVRAATNAGYATFAVDRIGTGVSSKPPSTQIDATAGAVALQSVVGKLRTGAISPRAFTKVVVVAHSLGAVHSWLMGNSADAVVASAELHRINHPAWSSFSVHPATSELRWALSGLDSGYVTTLPGSRSNFYYNTSGTIINEDEATKDLANNSELAQSYAMVDSAPASSAPSRALTKPVLVVVGDKDPFFCGGDSITCTPANVAAQEAPYYAGASSFTVSVLPNLGHSMALHASGAAAAFFGAVLNWVTATVPSTG